MTEAISTSSSRRSTLQTIAWLLLPILLLAGVIALFLAGGGLSLETAAPVEALQIERYTLTRGRIDIHIRNAGAEPLQISQVIVNDAVWPFHVDPAGTLPRLGKATIFLTYPWSHGEAYGITIFTSNAIAFNLDIPVAFATPGSSSGTFWSFALIGLYVGVIPVFLGILWFPALRQLGRRWMTFLMAITAGLLIFLGFDTLAEAFEKAAEVPGPFQGIGLIGIGAVGTFLLLDAVSRQQAALNVSESNRRSAIAFMIATGIGLHNLGEGLAIGAAYNIGEMALGTFLVVGFIIQNITEGLGIIAPLLREKPRLGQLALLGLIAGPEGLPWR